MYKKFCKDLLTVGAVQLQNGCVAYESHVREYRERKGLSQESLARQLGVTRQTVVNLERGENEPRLFLALAVATVLGAALSELFRKLELI